MDPNDQLDRVYEAIVHWADVVIVSTPIRWGNASALYYKMIERFNCIQNQVTIANRILLRNKVAGFIITGGQDDVQQVAGHLLGFFGEISPTSALARRPRPTLRGAPHRPWPPRDHAGTFGVRGRPTEASP